MLPSTQQIFQLLHLDLYLLRHVSVIHDHHQARIRIELLKSVSVFQLLYVLLPDDGHV
jgi:hypothetical protein